MISVGRIVPQWQDTRPGKGYWYVTLLDGDRRRTAGVHVVMLEAWDKPRPGPGYEACHWVDGDRADNRPWKLRWGTKADQQSDKVRHRELRGLDGTWGVEGQEKTRERGRKAEASRAGRAVTCVTEALHRLLEWFP